MLGSAFRLFNLNEVIDVQQLGILDEMNCIMCGKCEKECPADAVFINETFSNGLRILFRESSCDKLQKAYWYK